MKPRILFVSGREIGYVRNRVLLNALQQHADVAVITPNIRTTVGRSVGGLARWFVQRPSYDLCFVGFYSQPLAIALAALQRKPIICDAFVSTYDTLCEDRRWFRPRSPIGRLARWLDRHSCQVSACVLVDTQSNAQYFSEQFDIPQSKIAAVYVGCDETVFHPPDHEQQQPDQIEIFYYGAFLPLHGTEVIIRAAHLLRQRSDIHFTIGGQGPRYAAVRREITELGLENIDLVGWIPFNQVPGYIEQAAICLGGHFSTVPKAARVISTKTFQFVAMQRATIVGDNPAVREVFVPGQDVWAVEMGSPAALARGIELLADNAEQRCRIAESGYRVFQQKLSTQSIADQLAQCIAQVL